MGKKLDQTITTLKDFRYATRDIKDEVQLYVQLPDETSLIEITEVQINLAKNEEESEFLILKCS